MSSTPLDPPSIQHALAQRLVDVSPAWRDASIDPASASDDAPTGLSRDVAFGVESIREGWLLHRGASRLAPAASPDLALLIGDWCYATGLCSIADHGSLDDIAALADLVADVSARAGESIDQLEPRWHETTQELANG
jgi:hypothetical protein